MCRLLGLASPLRRRYKVTASCMARGVGGLGGVERKEIRMHP